VLQSGELAEYLGVRKLTGMRRTSGENREEGMRNLKIEMRTLRGAGVGLRGQA
jgi:hypothetical protein